MARAPRASRKSRAPDLGPTAPELRRGAPAATAEGWLGRVAPWLVATLAVAVYLGSLAGGFVWDDRFLVVDNPRIRSWAGLLEAFTGDYVFAAETNLAYGYYRPLSFLTLWLDHRLWGSAPAGFHATNVLLHAACSALVVLVAARLGLGRAASLVAGALFALHPVHTENVAWIAGRTDVLALLLSLASLLAFQVGPSRDARAPIAASLGLFAGALLAKEMAAVVPLWIGALVYFDAGGGRGVPRNGAARSAARAAAPYLLVLVAYLVVRFAVLGVAPPESPPEHALADALRSAPWTLARYLAWMAGAAPLSAYVQNPYVPSVADPRFWAATLALVALGAALVHAARRRPVVGLLAAMLAVSFAPVLNLHRLSGPLDMGNLMAERFCYFPSFPFVALVALGGAAAWNASRRRAPRVALAVLLALALFGGAARTWARTADWRSDRSLFEREARRTPGAPLLWVQLGQAALREGRMEEADAHLRRAEALAPDSAGVLAMRAQWLVFSGRLTEALTVQELVAAEIGERNPTARNNLAFLYRVNGRAERARPLLEELVATVPAYADPHLNLGELRRATGDPEGAATELRRFRALRPDDPRGLAALGEAEAALGRREAVEELYREELARRPSASTWNALALLRHRLGNAVGAREALERALAIDPRHERARFNLALVLDHLGDRPAARRELERLRREFPAGEAGRAAAARLAAWDAPQPSAPSAEAAAPDPR